MTGPNEPDHNQLNNILDLLVSDIKKLQAGIEMKIAGQEEKVPIHGHLHLVCADLPAQRRACGFLSHNSDDHMCIFCDKTFPSLTDPSCFDLECK